MLSLVEGVTSARSSGETPNAWDIPSVAAGVSPWANEIFTVIQ